MRLRFEEARRCLGLSQECYGHGGDAIGDSDLHADDDYMAMMLMLCDNMRIKSRMILMTMRVDAGYDDGDAGVMYLFTTLEEHTY